MAFKVDGLMYGWEGERKEGRAGGGKEGEREEGKLSLSSYFSSPEICFINTVLH